jgi:hypothetical protein
LTDAEKVVKKINDVLDRRYIATIALCKYYSEYAKQEYQRRQASDEFFTNRTNTLWATVKAESITGRDELGLFIAHTEQYGVYVELANDRKHEALWPIIKSIYSQFEEDLKRIWA